jgi:hypothetical protein
MTTQLLTSLKTPKRLAVLTALVLLTAASLSALWWPHVTSAATSLTAPDPVTAAWEKARAAGSYHFTSDVVQKIIPVASLTNVGRSSRSDALYLEGQNDLRAQTMELTLWSQGGSALNADSGVSLRTENGKTFTRRGNEAWQESDNFVDGFAPQGDFLGYLAAIRDVTAGATETRSGVTFTPYRFTIDGPAFAAYMHEQMIAALRAKGELPPGVQLEAPAYYRDMLGSGELWVGENGLPVRQILDLRFPEQNAERVEAAITVNFSNYGAEQTGLLTLLRTGQWQGAWLVLPSRLPDLTGLWLGLTLSVAACLVVRYRRTRAVQTAIVTAVIVSQVIGPLLSATSQTRFFDSYRAKAAAQEEQQAAATSERDIRAAVQAAPEFKPHQNPLENRDQQWEIERLGDYEIAAQAPNLSVSQSPNLQVSDPGTDTDGDTLTDFTELRIDTSEVISDTDDDGLNDNLEVNGFSLGGQTWYTDPNVTDSNNDGQSDVVEWGIDSATGLPQATPRDTDSDGLPDLFDPDNDNDGVADRVDSAPFAKGAATYSEANPLQLTINNLALDKPTFVDFQIRPTDPKNLWFAYNVLDWPQHSVGQMRDVDGKTYADVAAATGRTADASESNGDMKLLPMLEIRIPITSANLPSQAELTPFNISVNDFTADGQTKVAYVPLSMVNDPLTGERVAFSGQMRYKPTGSWSVPHSVRLAWVVQTLNDLPCDPKAADAAAQGCQSDGYIHNQPAMLHSYYDNWTLTGLSVREDNGASTAIVYEDPSVDPNKKDEAPLWGLTDALSEHFLKARDANNDGVRDLNVSDLPARFDRDNNPSAAQRFEIPNILQVVTNSYTTADEATMTTAMTTTRNILDTAFKTSVQADNAIKPLLLFVSENNLRAVGLDQVVGNEGYATQSGATVSLNLAPTPATALPVTVNANLKWMAYCGANGTNVTWRPCTSDEYADTIEARYANAPSLPDDTEPAEAPGRMMLALSYYFTLVGGYQAQLQEGTVIASSRYALEGESDTTTRIRLAIQGAAPLPQIVVQALIHIAVASGDTKASLTTQIKETLKGLGNTYYKEQKALAGLAIDADGNPITQTKAQIRAIKLNPGSTIPIKFARYAAAAPVGSAIMLLTTVLSQNPDLDVPTRAVLGAIGAAITVATTIYIPAATASDLYKFQLFTYDPKKPNNVKPSMAKIISVNLLKDVTRKAAFAVGLVVSVALIWGFFGYAAGSSGLAAGSPELNKAAAEAIAATVVAVLLALLSATFIGTIIVGIISVIDTILNLICELGVSQLRLQGGFYGGACFSLTTSATKVLAYFLYNYEPMIDTSRSDLMVAGSPNVTLTDPTKGYVPANTLTLNLPVTTTVVHKDPDPVNGLLINFYLWLYSPDNIRSSTFKYGLSRGAAVNQAVELNQMTGAWQDVREDHKYVLTPMYRGVAVTNPAPLTGIPLPQGINSSVPFSLTMDFAIPAYECFLIPIPYGFVVIPTPICHTRVLKNSNTMPITELKYDVLPNTLSEFLTLTNKPGGGLGQSWDTRFPGLADADGDGLRSTAVNGLDPNDNTWDADGDGLSDRFELNLQAAGVAYSPLLRDTDGDGLTDKQEATFSTDPLMVDTDNDGLSDGVEIRHQVYDVNGNLTAAWSGGWQVTINSTPALTVWVSSDPFNTDGDQDGISDQAEKELAANANAALRVDNRGIPYHPTVRNTPPLTILTSSDAFNGYIGPNQGFQYTTTVIANVPVAPGVLNISAPAFVGGAPNPLLLDFTGTSTVTRAAGFTVANNSGSQSFTLTSTVNTRLPNTSSTPWVWQTPSSEAGLGAFSTRLGRSIQLAALADRQDSYRLAGVASALAGAGDVFGYNLPDGTVTLLDTDAAGATSIRSETPATVACNLRNYCLVIWEKKPTGTGLGDLMGVVIQPGGNVATAAVTIAAGTTNSSSNSNPKVASDGTNFLVAWQQGLTLSGANVTYRTNLMTRLYREDGLPLTAAIMLPNEQIDATPTTSASIAGVNGSKDRRQQLDLDWLNGRYRLTRWIDLGAAATVPAADVNLTENGVATTNRQITWRDIDANGALIANSKFTVSGLLSGYPTDLSLSYHPSTNRVLLVVAGADTVEASPVIAARSFAGTGTTVSRSYTLLSTDATNNVETVYYPSQQGYLIGWSPTSNATNFTYKLYDSDVNELTQFGTPPAVTWPAATNTTVGAALACPAVSSQPVLDLGFEELPAPNGPPSEFPDNSGYNTAVFCDAGQCPAAGVTGAPNATRSDYALRFDGVNDQIFVNRTLTDDFTIAMWVKTNATAATATLIDQGLAGSTGWSVFLNGANIIVQVGDQQVVTSGGGINDNQWHFITITRNRATGAVTIYKDGTVLAGRSPLSTAALTGQSNIWVGGIATNQSQYAYKGDMDALQLYPMTLTASTIQALYNRTLQSYCVAAGVTATGNTFPWSRFGLQQQDIRGGRLTASAGLKVMVDDKGPEAQLTSHATNAFVAADTVIGGTASDFTGVGVGKVEVSTDNGVTWQTATGANTWSFSLAGLSGLLPIRVRATDLVGNVGPASGTINVTVDTTAPALTIDTLAATLKPTKNAAGQWQVGLRGTATDSGGLKAGSLVVKLTQASGVGVDQSQQATTVNGGSWNLNYLLAPGLFDPTGAYTVTIQVDDAVGNRTLMAPKIVRLDATGPVAALSATDLARTVISQTVTIGGVISDTNSIVGLDRAEIAFTPIDQIAALPVGLTSTQAEAQLNRQWRPVTLAQLGAGVAQTTWRVAIPTGLEDSYQIDLRGYDWLGNVSITSGLWQGIIDTRDPRVVMNATATGATYVNTADNTQRYEVRFVCGVQDRNLNEASFVCPGEGLAQAVRSFDNNPALQALFPDLTLRTGLAISYTLWTTTTTPAATAHACDTFGRCTQASTPSTGSGAGGVVTAAGAELVEAAAAPGAPLAVIVNPTHNSFVAAGSVLSVTVAAEAGAGLKEVTIKLDNATVQTLSFAQSPAITRTVRTINVPVTTEGPHTLVAQATAWDNSSQSTLFPVVFTLDQNAPVVTIDASALTIADTWQAQSGVLRFNGNASDSVGLAAVQIKEGDNEFTDATFGNGTWRVALPVEDPEGRNVVITVRAIDRAGRITTISQQIATDLSAVDAPDTRIIAGPANPSAVNSASFVFTSTVSAFECSLDDGVYTPCATPTTYNDLSKGSHTFRVRAIDSRGLPDLSPAEYTWTVNATALDVTITNAPATPTSSRSASFAFSGNGASYECSLDGAAFAACVSPANYSGLSNGEHSFLVRARNGGSIGAAARHLWTIANAVPVAASQTISTTQDKAVAITLTATDEDALIYRIVSQPDHGLLLGTPPALSYTPNTGFVGMDSFTFVASDGQSEAAPALVTINVGALPPPTTANVTILLDMQPNSAVNQSFVGSLGAFMLDDASPDDNDGIANRRTFTVAPGSYTVRHNKTAWVTTALACTPTTGAVIDLNAGSVALTLAAGNNVTCTFTQVRSAQITARAFEDRVRIGTNLGKRNAGDPWLPGRSLTLFTTPGAPVATLVTEGTAVAGLFEAVFRFLRPGAYMLCTTLPAGWTTTTPPAIDPAYGQACKPVTLNPGQAATLLFGAYPPVVAAESESFTPEEEVITDDDTLIDLPEDTTEETPGAMVNQIFLPLAAR